MDNAIILAQYCERKLVRSPFFSDYIFKHPSFIFTLIDKNAFDLTIKGQVDCIENTIKLGKIRNIKCEAEIKSFKDFQDRYVGMKGYFLQKAYYPSKYTRIYNDIDILAKIDDGYSVYKLLKKNGYSLRKSEKFTQETHGFSLFRRFYLMNTQHIELVKQNTNSYLEHNLELHANINVNSPTCKITFATNRMIDESIKKTVNGIEFRVFSPEDHILYLMFHIIKHLSYITLYDNEKAINLQGLYDVAQIITSENIDWDKFSARAIEYNITPFVSFFIKIYIDIFEGSIPEQVLTNALVHAKSIDFKWKPVFNKVMKKKPCDLIIGDYHDMPLIERTYSTAEEATDKSKVWKQSSKRFKREFTDYYVKGLGKVEY